MTLSDLKRISSILAIRRLCTASGIDPSTMRSRLKRGGPELTRDEAKRIAESLESVGLRYRR